MISSRFQKNLVQQNCGPKINVGPKKCWSQKISQTKHFSELKFFWQIFFYLTFFWNFFSALKNCNKFLVQKNVKSKKIQGPKKCLIQKKFWVPKNFIRKKFLFRKKGLVKDNVWSVNKMFGLKKIVCPRKKIWSEKIVGPK